MPFATDPPVSDAFLVTVKVKPARLKTPLEIERSLIVIFPGSVGWFGRPALLITTSFPAPGTVAGLQLDAVFQSELVAPVQVCPLTENVADQRNNTRSNLLIIR